jgi:hypothetical protein
LTKIIFGIYQFLISRLSLKYKATVERGKSLKLKKSMTQEGRGYVEWTPDQISHRQNTLKVFWSHHQN